MLQRGQLIVARQRTQLLPLTVLRMFRLLQVRAGSGVQGLCRTLSNNHDLLRSPQCCAAHAPLRCALLIAR